MQVSLEGDTSFDYVTVGHVTVDVIDEGSDATRRQPGGGAFYSALQASRLGLRTLIVTRGNEPELSTLLAPYTPEVDIHVIPSEHTTTLATSWQAGVRTQRVLAWAGSIDRLPSFESPILHLAPVARETPAGLVDCDAGPVGVDIQKTMPHVHVHARACTPFLASHPRGWPDGGTHLEGRSSRRHWRSAPCPRAMTRP